MNKIIIGIIAVFFMCTACEDAFDRNYDVGSEKFYPPKVINVTGVSGLQRVMISWDFSVKNVNTAKKVLITVEGLAIGYKDSILLNELVNTYEISGLQGDVNYKFNVQTVDSEGNYSIIEPSGEQTTHVYVYGESFGVDLKPIKINSMILQEDSLLIEFGSSNLIHHGSEFSYYRKSTGEETVIRTTQEDDNIVLKDVDITKAIKYRTFYVPTESFIDEFPSEWNDLGEPEAISDIVNSIVVRPILGGIVIDWSNPSNLDISVDAIYRLNDVETTSTFNSNSSQDIGVTALGLGLYDISVIVSDSKGTGINRTFSAEVLELPVKLDNTAWTIHDESLSRPDYPASNFIDGNYATFWHTPNAASVSPTGETPSYPHYITVDLGSVKTVVQYKLFRRVGQTSGPNAHEIWVSADDMNYTKVAIYNGTIPDDNGVLLATDEELVRYVKYIAVSGPNFFTHMAEIEVYGIE